MLGTAGSFCCCLKHLEEKGVKQENVIMINLISCPEGIERVSKEYPKVRIYTAIIDEKLNEEKYIVPGIGDYGDLYFNTI